MGKKRVEAHEVLRKGKSSWRVIIPADLNEGKIGAARYFRIRRDATDYARNLENQRAGNTNDFMVLPQLEQASVIRALERLNNDGAELERAVDFYLRSRPANSGKTVSQVVAECL